MLTKQFILHKIPSFEVSYFRRFPFHKNHLICRFIGDSKFESVPSSERLINGVRFQTVTNVTFYRDVCHSEVSAIRQLTVVQTVYQSYAILMEVLIQM